MGKSLWRATPAVVKGDRAEDAVRVEMPVCVPETDRLESGPGEAVRDPPGDAAVDGLAGAMG